MQKYFTCLFMILALTVGTALPPKASYAQDNVEMTTPLPKLKRAKDSDEEEPKIDAPIVIELFTMSDCSACVLADRLLYDAMKDKNVIGLSCHVRSLEDAPLSAESDVGNAAARETQPVGPIDPCVFRQWTYYSSSDREVSIRIPLFIFNGTTDMGISSITRFQNTLDIYHYASRNRTLEAFMQWKDKDTITINLPEDEKRFSKRKSASVTLVRYKDMEVHKIDEGVNKGRVLRFSNIIQYTQHIGKWYGAPRTLEVDVAPPQGGKLRGGYAIIVQELLGDPIVVAGHLRDYPMPNDRMPAKAPRTQTEQEPPAVPPDSAPAVRNPVNGQSTSATPEGMPGFE